MIGSPIDTDRFAPPARREPPEGRPARLVAVGRLVEKGFADAIEAVARLRAQRRDVTLDILGEGPLRADLERRAGPGVRLLGAASSAGVLAALHRADIALAPSVTAADGDRDGPVNALKEAMATGLPVMGTRHGGIPELVEREASGLLVSERDPRALARGLAPLIDAPGDRASFGAAERRRPVRSHDRCTTLRATLDACRRALAENGGQTHERRARATVIVTQRERFGMTAESLDSLHEHTAGAEVVHVDGDSPERVADHLRAEPARRGFRLIRRDRFLTPNEARDLGVRAARTEHVVFVDDDVLCTEGWLARLIACADETGAEVVAPLTCQGLPAHTEIHHAGGDYAPGGDMAGFEADPERGRAFDEVMHGHGEPVAHWQGEATRRETGMCEFHCVLARRDLFDRIGPLDEKMPSTKEHIDFSMSVKAAGGRVMLEPSSVVTYVFPCRARPLNTEDWPFFALRWSDAHGRRSLEHFVAKWGLRTKPGYVREKRGIHATRRMQGIVIPMMRRLPLIGRHDRLAKAAPRASMAPERLLNRGHVARHDRRSRAA